MMEEEQLNAVMKSLDDAQWFDGIYLAGLSTHVNWEVVCKFCGLHRDYISGNYNFDINEWRHAFEEEDEEDWSLQFFSLITR